MKLWAGRFQEQEDQRVNDFNSSISFDARMFRQDIAGSMVHARMLASRGIISEKDAAAILDGLQSILDDLEQGKLDFDPEAEDIHMFIESELTTRIGDAGKRLHTARSRNDQVALDLKLYLRDEAAIIHKQIRELVTVICDKAQEHLLSVMPGYTHLQIAQPVTFGHHIMAYAAMLLRDLKRLENALVNMNESPLGSGALAGTTYPIDRQMTAHSLGFATATANSIDGVSDRDYCIELLSAFSILMMHLSRFSEEIVLWCSWEFRYIELDDAFSTGSSIMPQKKNPDVAELVRGKTGRVYGDLITLLTVMKGLPLAYNKDMQEDKEAIFDAIDTVKICLKTFIPMFASMRVRPENMLAHASKGFINATDCADYLTRKGLPFRDAYQITGRLVALCIDRNLTFETLPLEDYRQFSNLFSEDIYAAVDIVACAKNRGSYGGPAPQSVEEQIRMARQRIASYNE